MSWKKVTDKFYILINGGPDDDYSGLEETLYQIKLTQLNVFIIISKFEGFSKCRNKLLDSVLEKDRFNVNIDDSYELISFKPLKNLCPQQVTIQHLNVEYKSVRILEPDSTVRYIHPIHEVLDTEVRHDSGIIIIDRVYPDHIKRTESRQLYQYTLLKDLTDPRSMYYKACTLLNLFKQRLVKKETVIMSINEFLMVGTDPLQVKLCNQYLKCLCIDSN